MLEADAHHKMQRAEGSCRVGECLRAHGRQKPATGAIKGLGNGAVGQWVSQNPSGWKRPLRSQNPTVNPALPSPLSGSLSLRGEVLTLRDNSDSKPHSVLD